MGSVLLKRLDSPVLCPEYVSSVWSGVSFTIHLDRAMRFSEHDGRELVNRVEHERLVVVTPFELKDRLKEEWVALKKRELQLTKLREEARETEQMVRGGVR